MKSSPNLPHPIPYQGSKRILAPKILPFFPDNISRLVEPFAGSAAISIAAAHWRFAEKFVINDAHKPLVMLWEQILNSPELLASRYAKLWHSQAGNEREFFNEVRGNFNRTHRPDYFLYLLARCVKAAIRYNSNGEFNNTPDNRRKGARPDEMKWRVTETARLLGERSVVSCLDYRKVLESCRPDDLVYMDPPYQGVCGNRDQRYAPKVDHAEFCDALADLNRRKCRYIVSYDGRRGDTSYGKPLPKSLRLVHLELTAGRSTQATLLGRSEITHESLYVSTCLVNRPTERQNDRQFRQLALFGVEHSSGPARSIQKASAGRKGQASKGRHRPYP